MTIRSTCRFEVEGVLPMVLASFIALTAAVGFAGNEAKADDARFKLVLGDSPDSKAEECVGLNGGDGSPCLVRPETTRIASEELEKLKSVTAAVKARGCERAFQ